jgi:hypothetical protein
MVSVPLTDTINVLLTDTTNAFCSSGILFNDESITFHEGIHFHGENVNIYL